MELTGESSTAAFDPADFRRTLGSFPTGVVIVTGHGAVGPAGLVIGSFTSVSLDPALVGFFPAKSSSSWPRIAPTGSFCVNVLGADQLALCESFASRGGDKFESVAWRAAATGSPVLEGVIAWIDCRIERIDAAGDHWFVLGRVEQMGADRDDDIGPLVFCRGAFGRFVPAGVAGLGSSRDRPAP